MRKLLLIVMALAVLFSPGVSRAEDAFEFVIRKQKQKESSRWTLEGWLAQRDRMRLMDLWLALHSPSPYEFFVGGEYRMFTPEGASQVTGGWNTHAAAYASIFGLELSYASFADQALATARQMQALFNLRIFGYNSQGTNITLHTGVRMNRGNVNYQSAMAGVSMTINLAKFFGIDGVYLHQFSSTPNSSGNQFSGNTYGGGAFIDFRFVRVYGQYRRHDTTVKSGAAESVSGASEVAVGTRIFF